MRSAVIDRSHPAISFPRFLYTNDLLHIKQDAFGKFAYKNVAVWYASARAFVMHMEIRNGLDVNPRFSTFAGR